MGEIKNPFNFGTGNIDKDQWLKDIDNELEDFISKYGSATNKHRTALIRLAFLDLRSRIANGDMLGRTADGLYQFSSALNREDKHMQEAYQRALGFMGNLARRQINTPVTEPEKKKYSTAILNDRFIKYFNPSGSKESFTSLWNSFDDATRKSKLLEFLRGELNNGLNNYQDVEDYESMDNLKLRINDFLATSDITNLNRLGFTRNYLNALTSEEENEEEPKSRLELALEKYQAAVADQQAALIEQLLANMNAPAPLFSTLLNSFNPEQYWTYDSFVRERDKAIEALKYTDENGNEFLKANSILRRIPTGNGHFTNQVTTRNTAWNGKAATDAIMYAQKQYTDKISNDLSNYFKNLGVNYQSYLENETAKNNLRTNLSKLFTLNAEGKFELDLVLNKLFVKQEDGKYGLRGSTLSYDPVSHTLYKGNNIDTYEEGGIIKGQSGLIVDPSYYLNPPKSNKEQKTDDTSSESKLQFSSAENARIAATIADIASMGAAFVPGYGTATSAILGLGSTATNFGADLADGQGLWGATKNAGFGLAADVMGLIPGLGGIGKGAKIARNLMWAVPKMMQWANTYQGLQNAGEIKNSIMKLTSPSSMTVQDWQNVSQALQIMTGHGRSVATKIKKAGMSKTTTTTDPEYYIFTNKDKQKVSDETFRRLREARGTKARQALTLELIGEGVILQQTRFAPWNTSTRFGAFKEIPGKTKVEVKNKHNGWFSDENLVEKAENFDPSVDIRSILHKVNPYRAYYSNRVPKSSPLPEYLQRPVDILPQGFGMTKSGMAAGGFNMDKPKRKPLTEELKAARRLKSTAKKQEQKAKELENLRRLQMYGMSEEIPQASSQAINVQRKLEHTNLSSRFANEVEMPGPQMETLKNKFYRRYGNAVRGHQIGGILKALRNGGIIKALWGIPGGFNTTDYRRDKEQVDMSLDPGTLYYDPREAQSINFGSIYSDPTFIDYNNRVANGAAGRRSTMGNLADTLGLYMHNDTLDYQSAMDALKNYYTMDNGKNIMGDVLSYYNNVWLKDPTSANKTYADFVKAYNANVDELRAKHKTKFSTGKDVVNTRGWDKFNTLHRQMYGSYGKYVKDNGEIGDDWDENAKDILGESTWRRLPNAFSGKEYDKLRQGYLKDGDNTSYVYMDNNGHLQLTGGPKQESLDPYKVDSSKKDDASIADEEIERDNIFKTLYRNPIDPTLPIIGAKTAMGLIGNDNIYRNLLDEMPQAPLRDPIQRQLAIVGWQDRIKNGQNQIADIRNINRRLFGYDPQTNFATSLETERTGRDISDKAFAEDAGRQFETAQKLWNLKNEDTMYNIGVGDANRRSIADRARMMAQIRAAWRSGNNNILMGALSDTGNWLMKRYQREQDLTDKVKELSLGNLESYADWALRNNPTYKQLLAKKLAGTLTEADRAKMLEIKMSMLDKLANEYADKYYNLYHTPLFGGGAKELLFKDGGSLEKEKLKARGKDNDRYVSMIKDLRTTTYRRRRRR